MTEKKDKPIKLLKTFSIHETNLGDVKKIARILKGYKHVENMLNLLLRFEFEKAKAQSVEDLDSKNEIWVIFNLLKNPVIMKAVLNKNKGGKKTQQQIKLVNDYFKDNQLFQQMISVSSGKEFNDKNLSMMVRRLASAWSNYFANLKDFFVNKHKYTGVPSTPKSKKLSRLTEFSLPLEKSKWALKKNGEMRLTLGKYQINVYLGNFDEVKYLKNKQINGVTVCYSHGHIHYALNYLVETISKTEQNARKEKEKQEAKNLKKIAPKKVAGLDIGVHNLITLYINDQKSKTLIFSGKELISYNSNFNKRLSKIASDLEKNVVYRDEDGNVVPAPDKNSKEKVKKEYNSFGKKLNKRRSQIFERRRLFQEDYLHKLSKKIVQYLVQQGVDRLVLSKNLSFAKQKGEIQNGKKNNQKFYQLSFGRLLNLIEDKARNQGILVISIDEAYTSKTSALSADVNAIVKKVKTFNQSKVNKEDKISLNPTDFSGSRGFKQKGKLNNPLGRGLFKDIVLNKVLNADINAAANHIKVGFPKISINQDLWKFCNPIKISSNSHLDKFLKRNNESNKLTLVG